MKGALRGNTRARVVSRFPNSCVEPQDDGGEDYPAAVDQGVLVVAGGQVAPVLKFIVGPFNDIPVLVVLGLEVDWAPAAGTSILAVSLLIAVCRDDDPHPSRAQSVAVGSCGIGLAASRRGGGWCVAKPSQPAGSRTPDIEGRTVTKIP